MTQHNNPDQIQRLARHLAGLGRENAERLQLVAEEALRLLDDPELVIPDVQPEAFPWEQEEPEVSGQKGIYLATVADDATGEGLTVYFAAVLTRQGALCRGTGPGIWHAWQLSPQGQMLSCRILNCFYCPSCWRISNE